MAWTDADHDQVVKTLMIVCEVTGTEMSPAAAKFIVKQLSAYPAAQVAGGLERCASECKFKLTLADVVSRLDDGRPGAEEAWGLFPKREEDAGCVTDEMTVAWAAAAPLYAHDHVGARMAFKEVYDRAVRNSRAEGRDVRWSISPGFNRTSTEDVAIEALRLGRISEKQAVHFLRSPESLRLALPSTAGPERLLADVSTVPDPRTTTSKKATGSEMSMLDRRRS